MEVYLHLLFVYEQEDGTEISETDSEDTTNLDSYEKEQQHEDKMITSSSSTYTTIPYNSTTKPSNGMENYWNSILSVNITVAGD